MKRGATWVVLPLVMGALNTGRARSESDLLTLEEAVRMGMANQPSLREARANADVAAARADEARAPLLPLVSAAASYQRATANTVSRPGTPAASTSGTTTGSGQTYPYYSANLSFSQLLWDFGQTSGRWRAAGASARAAQSTAEAQRQQALFVIRASYFAAQAARALVAVAREAVDNNGRRLAQIGAFVDAGMRPEIDLARVQTDRANAEVRLIQAENNYVATKAELNVAMGVEQGTEYDVAIEVTQLPSTTAGNVETLVVEALRARPEPRAAGGRVEAQMLSLRAARGGYWPALALAGSASDAGLAPDRLTWNWGAQLALSWTLFQGALTPAQVREQEAQVRVTMAQRDGLRQQVRLEVIDAYNAVRAGGATVIAATRATESARRQLALAEARYDNGLGSALELGDAQLAVTNAGAQEVGARYTLATAKAQLSRALGER